MHPKRTSRCLRRCTVRASHLFVDALRGADQVRRIACATGHDGLFERQAGDLLDLIDDLAHGGAFAGADVEGVVLALVTVEVLEGGDVASAKSETWM